MRAKLTDTNHRNITQLEGDSAIMQDITETQCVTFYAMEVGLNHLKLCVSFR